LKTEFNAACRILPSINLKNIYYQIRLILQIFISVVDITLESGVLIT